jgi:hypothetical protein
MPAAPNVEAQALTPRVPVCFHQGSDKEGGTVMLALIFTIQAIALILVLQEKEKAAVGCFWASLALTLIWFNHHATESLGFLF